jgi:tetratricopeptide (TPR) repeat protein
MCRGWCSTWLILAALACLCLPDRLAAMAEPPVVGKIVTVQGQVYVRRGEAAQWEAAQAGQSLMAGDAVRTGASSRCSVLCVDESQIKLNENTTIILKSIAPSPRMQPMAPAKEQPPAASQYEVPEGEIWLRNKNEKFRFDLDTPAVTATIRGTELNVRVERNGTTSVILLEGNICLTNPQGEVCLRPGEEGYTIPGQKPGKRVLVQPADAVQWVLYYPGIFGYRDLPLAALPEGLRAPAGPPAAAELVRQGEAAYDQGRLEDARRDAEASLARAPDNSRALTLLGWVNLQKGAVEEAQSCFRRVRQPDELTIIGTALSRYRLGDVVGAYDYLKGACGKAGLTPVMATMCGYFALMTGKVKEARAQLEAAARQSGPVATLAQSLLSQIYLVQNRKELALREASAAISRSPASPAAQFSFALVKLASFDLPTATRHLEKAVQADPDFVSAYVYLAKIWLGSEYLGRAQKTIARALNLAPNDPQVLSLAGFIRLAYRDYRSALQLWTRALRADPGFGEPHLGLAIYYFRYREFHRGLEEMLTASLLDPRVASYQTELGKALYQTRSFDRSLEVYDYAKTLDPRDPTPYFYKGIALSDLNRPGEAIQEINKSIELNDNVAMFRSRSLLDRDLAVRNYSLARSYQQLGLTDWGLSKAVTAVKYEPYNSSAHLFLRDITVAARSGSEAPFLTAGLLFSTGNLEAALYRVLSPANQATFSSLQLGGTETLGLTNDYTPMYEMPYARFGVSGGIGATDGTSGSKMIQEHQGFVYGGMPGAAFQVSGLYGDNRGLPRPTDITPPIDNFSGASRVYDIQTAAKWEPTVQGTLTGLFQYAEQKTSTQISLRTDSGGTPVVVPSITQEQVTRARFYEAAYYYRFNPNSSFLAYFSHVDRPRHSAAQTFANFNVNFTDPFLPSFIFPATLQEYRTHTFDREFNNVQFQKRLRLSFLGQHTLTAGVDYFSSAVSQRDRATTIQTVDTSQLARFLAQLGFPGLVPDTTMDVIQAQSDFRPPYWSYSFYLTDYWRPHKNLVLEWAVFKDFVKAPQENFQGTFYTSLWSPRFGANYQFGIGGTQHVLRAALERHLTSHLVIQPILVPSEVASFPWAIDTVSPNAEVRQAGAAWEAQWGPKTFTALRLNALRVANPTFEIDPTGAERPIWQNWRRYQASLVLNRILFTSLGLSLGLMGKRVIPDFSFQPALESYSELNAFFGLAYLHRQGWLARIKPLLVQQYGKIQGHQADNPFVIMNLTFGREFPNKRGFALFEVQNLFNRQVFYSLEPFRDLEFSNQRRFLFRLGLYF